MHCAKSCRRYAILGEYACHTSTNPENDLVADGVLQNLPDVPANLVSEVEYAIRTKIVREESKRGMGVIKHILSTWGEPIIGLTRADGTHPPEDDAAGVLFDMDRVAARFGLEKVIGRMTNLRNDSAFACISRENNFYNYYSERFESNPIPLLCAEMDNNIDAPFQYVASIKKTPLLEFISRKYPTANIRRRTEVVIDVGCSYRHDKHLIVPKFEYNDNYWVFRHPKLVKDCIVHKHSVVQEIHPDTMYLTRKVDEDERFIYLNVLRRYELCTRLALYDTRKSITDLTFDKFDIDSYHPNDVIRFDVTIHPKSYGGCLPVVLSAEILFNVLKLFGDLEMLNININDGLHPVGIENERNSVSEPVIEVVVMPIITGKRG